MFKLVKGLKFQILKQLEFFRNFPSKFELSDLILPLVLEIFSCETPRTT